MKKQSQKRTVAEIVTESILASLEAGVAPWRKPWSSGIPRSLSTGKAYRGINAFILALAPFSSPYWLTRKQVEARGGSVRPEQRGKYWPVVFWTFDREDSAGANVLTLTSPRKASRTCVLMRFYQVYNVSQCEGISAPQIGLDFVPIERAAEIVAAMPSRPQVTHGGDVACYLPREDRVQMPPPARFRNAEGYYATLFHELGHSTGHASRLARKGVDGVTLAVFGSGDYSREELVAEMTAAFLSAEAGIDASTQEVGRVRRVVAQGAFGRPSRDHLRRAGRATRRRLHTGPRRRSRGTRRAGRRSRRRGSVSGPVPSGHKTGRLARTLPLESTDVDSGPDSGCARARATRSALPLSGGIGVQ